MQTLVHTHSHTHRGGGRDSLKGLWTVLLGNPLPLDLRRHREPAGGAPQGGATAMRVDVRVHRHFLLNDMRRNWERGGTLRVFKRDGSLNIDPSPRRSHCFFI